MEKRFPLQSKNYFPVKKMNYLDLIIILFFLFAGFKGFFRGFVLEFFSLIGFFLGIFLAIEFTSPITYRFFSEAKYIGLISVGIFLAVFIAISIVVNLAAKVLKKAINLTMLSAPDKLLGGAFAILKWCLFASVIIWIFDSIGVVVPERLYEESTLFPIVASMAPTVFEYASALLPWFHDIFDFMESFDQKEKFVMI